MQTSPCPFVVVLMLNWLDNIPFIPWLAKIHLLSIHVNKKQQCDECLLEHYVDSFASKKSFYKEH